MSHGKYRAPTPAVELLKGKRSVYKKLLRMAKWRISSTNELGQSSVTPRRVVVPNVGEGNEHREEGKLILICHNIRNMFIFLIK